MGHVDGMSRGKQHDNSDMFTNTTGSLVQRDQHRHVENQKMLFGRALAMEALGTR
jgi:hypothetical protein